MSAILQYRRYPASMSKEELTATWNEAVNYSLYEDGRSYTGEIGMFGPGLDFIDVPEDFEEPKNYLADRHHKWDCALALSYKGKWHVGGWCSS